MGVIQVTVMGLFMKTTVEDSVENWLLPLRENDCVGPKQKIWCKLPKEQRLTAVFSALRVNVQQLEESE